MTNIHLLGGEEMIQAAREAKDETKSAKFLFFNWRIGSYKS